MLEELERRGDSGRENKCEIKGTLVFRKASSKREEFGQIRESCGKSLSSRGG